MKKSIIFVAAALFFLLGIQSGAAEVRPGLDASVLVSQPQDETLGRQFGFSVDPDTSLVYVLNPGRDVINGNFNVQSVICTDCVSPCAVPAVRTVQVNLVANTNVAPGYGVSALTNANYMVTDVQYSTQAGLTNGSPLIITITGNVLDCGDWFNVFFDVCDSAPPGDWTDPCSPTSAMANLTINEWADAGTNVDYIELDNKGSSAVTLTANLEVVYNSTTVTVSQYMLASNNNPATDWVDLPYTVPAGEKVILVDSDIEQADINTIRGWDGGTACVLIRTNQGTLIGSGDRLDDTQAYLQEGGWRWSRTPELPNSLSSTYSGLLNTFVFGTDATTDETKWYTGIASSARRTPGAANGVP